MKSCKTLCIISCIALLSGCAMDVVMPPYEDHPNLRAAEMARDRGDVPQAIHDYRDIIKEAPFCAKAYLGLGMSLLDANAVDEAKKTFEKAIAMFPKCSGAYAGLGAVYLIIDQPENAINSFDQALIRDSRNAKALNGYGIALDMIGDHEAAQVYYRAVMEVDPCNLSFESNLGLSMVLAGNTIEGIHILERLSRSPQATPRVRQNLALAYGLVGDMKMAKKIGRLDLPDDFVMNNISYFEAIQQRQEFFGMIPKNNTIPLDQTRKWQEAVY